MSFIIKGIDLPPNSKVQIIVESPSESFRKQIPKSRIIQIPKGHGDIKDENEIIKRLERKEREPLYQHDTDDWWVGIIDAETVVNSSPTILEAEREE